MSDITQAERPRVGLPGLDALAPSPIMRAAQRVDARENADAAMGIRASQREHIRAVAINAVTEAMGVLHGRTRFSASDALRADLIFKTLMDTPPSALEDAKTHVAGANVKDTALLGAVAQAIGAQEGKEQEEA